MVRVNTLRPSAIAAAIMFAFAALAPAVAGEDSLWSTRTSISDERLDAMRGGFEAANGLQLSFGIERAVFINGELVAVTRLVLSDLTNLLNGGVASAQVLANAFTIVQNGPGNSVVTDNGSTSTGARSVQLNGQTLVLPSATAIVTAVQNSLNNQIIQTRTSIDATLNSLSILRSGAFADALRQQALDSVRR